MTARKRASTVDPKLVEWLIWIDTKDEDAPCPTCGKLRGLNPGVSGEGDSS